MLTIRGRNVAVEPIFDPDETKGQATYTKAELDLMKEMGVELDRSAGSLIVPDAAKERCDQGIVKYVGKDCRWVKAGDYVLFSGYSGDLIRLEGEGLMIIMPEQAVVAVIHEVPPVEVSGVYYREKFDKEKAGVALYEILAKLGDDLNHLGRFDLAKYLAEKGVTPPAALNFFPATYETLINQIAVAFQNQEWRRNLGIKNKRVTRPDYVETFEDEEDA